MATKGKTTSGEVCFFGAGLLPFSSEERFSSSVVGGGRPFLSKFLTAGRLFSGDVLGPVKRQVPSPVVRRYIDIYNIYIERELMGEERKTIMRLA